ncbi:MAG: YraN family protein [Gammaproteobacteria bacterium]|nr:YraN family protein [Gammaproteobacteria bacterium]
MASPRPTELRQAAARARSATGAAAEERAARHLTEQGLEVLLRNWRCRLGELDLIARAGAVLVIAEVRCRTHGDYGGAAASVSIAKRQRIVRATRHLLMLRPELARLPVRFDVIAIDGEAGHLEWIRGAFDAG